MGKTVDIECTAEIEIDEYVTEISDVVLMQEAVDRLETNNNKEFKGQILGYLFEDDDVIVDVISNIKDLNIIDADKLRVFLTNLG